MRFVAVLSLLSLAACTSLVNALAGRGSAKEPIASASGSPKPSDQANEMKEKGVANGLPEEREDVSIFTNEAKTAEGRAGKIETVDLLVKPDDTKAKHTFMQLLLDEDWLLVKTEKKEDGSAAYRFIRPAKMRVETPADGRAPGIVNPK